MLATRNLCLIVFVIPDKDAISTEHRPTDHYMRVMRAAYYVCNIYEVQLIAVFSWLYKAQDAIDTVFSFFTL